MQKGPQCRIPVNSWVDSLLSRGGTVAPQEMWLYCWHLTNEQTRFDPTLFDRGRRIRVIDEKFLLPSNAI